jgi:hypothetical protein
MAATLRFCVLIATVLLLSACAPTAPTAPSRPTSPTNGGPPFVPGTPAGRLVIDELRVTSTFDAFNGTSYETWVALREVTGLHAVTIEAVTIQFGDGTGTFTRGSTTCGTPEHIAAGATWTTDQMYPYCRETMPSAPAGFAATVLYRDDEGRRATVGAWWPSEQP